MGSAQVAPVPTEFGRVPNPSLRRLQRTWSKLELPALALSSRYSVAKFVAMQEYISRASRWRVFWVLVTMPLPALASALLPAFLPLRAPREGPTWGFYLHVWFVVFIVSLGNMVSWAAITQIPRRIYSIRDAVSVSVVCALIQLANGLLIWRFLVFPVPFMWITCFGLWASNLVLSNVLVLRQRIFTHRAEWIRSLKQYLPSRAVQMAQAIVYPTISIIYDRVSTRYQIALALLFPVIKMTVKHVVKRLSRETRDHSGEVPVSAVEISGSVYQAMIMQTAPSKYATILLTGLDFVQGVVSIKLFMDRPTGMPRHQIQQQAVRIATKLSRSQRLQSAEVLAVVAGTSTRGSARRSLDLAAAGSPMVDLLPREVMRHALQLAHAAETILLVEYYEVVIPLVVVAFLLVACPLDSARYNTKLSHFHSQPELLTRAVESILV